MKIQKFDLLLAVYTGCIAISELMGSKTVPLFTVGNLHLTTSVAILVVPLLFAINDTVVETHGKDRARSIVYSGLAVIFLLLGMSLLATHLPPSPRFAASNAAYSQVFGTSARIAAASITSFALAELLDVWLFSRIRQRLGTKALWFRTNVSNICAQFIDTTVFIVLAFYAFGTPAKANASFLIGLILPYWILKCCMSVLETPLVYAGVKWLRGEPHNMEA